MIYRRVNGFNNLHQTSDYCGSLDTINLKLLQNLQTVFLLGMDLVNQDLYWDLKWAETWFQKTLFRHSPFHSVHGHPEFLGVHPYPHCVLIFYVFLSTFAPTLPPKKPISGYKTHFPHKKLDFWANFRFLDFQNVSNFWKHYC